MALTDFAVRNAKPTAKDYKLHDEKGLYLQVGKSGSKLWRLKYRIDGKEKKLSIGSYPEIGPKEAHNRVMAARKQLDDGINPRLQKDIQKLTAKVPRENSFNAVAEEYFAKITREGRSEATLLKKRWFLTLADPAPGDRPINEITPVELLAVLRKIEAKGNHETANRLRATCGLVFRYAIATGRAERHLSAGRSFSEPGPDRGSHAGHCQCQTLGAGCRVARIRVRQRGTTEKMIRTMRELKPDARHLSGDPICNCAVMFSGLRQI
jgi:hypothetical protein